MAANFCPDQAPSRFPVLTALVFLAIPAAASDQSASDALAAHRAHAAALQKTSYTRKTKRYDIPAIELVDMDGSGVSLEKMLNDGSPVMLNFIFTSCTAVCPVLSITFARAHELLGPERDKINDKINMVSISIDPEYDTPERLRAYAKRFKAGPNWHFLTGDLARIASVQKAFDAYRGNKMNHVPLTFLRAKPGAAWVRLEGFAGAADLVKELGRLPLQ